MPTPPPEQKKKSPSSQIRHTTLADYVIAHSKPNGGFKGFLSSNLFSGIVVLLLGQLIFLLCGVAAAFFAVYMTTNKLAEWKTAVDLTLKRMDEYGTIHSHYEIQRVDGRVNQIERTVSKLELADHDRLTREMEELRKNHK